MSQKQYWSDLEDRRNIETQKEIGENEFKEELPFDLSESVFNATTPRRDFLKFLGFSTLAATIVSSCEMPVRKAIPYAIKPEDITPGVPNYYASTFVDGGDYCPVVVKTREGRPIKVEGNELSSITRGGTSARVQASVLNLYDKARLTHPISGGKEVTFDALDREIKEGLAGKNGYLVTCSMMSPSTEEVLKQFLAKFPGIKHINYDAISYSGMLQANEASYGKRTLPTYHFDKAATIVSIDADFLGTWMAPIEFSKGYAQTRKISAKNPTLSKHYHVEAIHTITGAAADERATCRPSEVGAVAIALYNAVNGTAPSLPSAKLNKMIAAAAEDLKKGNGLVVCGSNDMNVQMVVNAINNKIGADGNTVNWVTTSNTWKGIDKDMADMITAMEGGQVGVVMLHGVNPVYDHVDSKRFTAALAKVPMTISFAERMDETAQKCKYVIPDHNYLESWGDAEPKVGYYSLMQPAITPLFKTRAFQDSLMSWMDAGQTYGDYWQLYWTTQMGGQANFDMALQSGVMEPEKMPNGAATFVGNVGAAIAAVQAKKAASGLEVVVYQKVGIGHGGAWSNNPWLQEMPDPMTRSVWDNYLCVSPKRAKQLGAELTGFSEVDYNKYVAKVTGANGYAVNLPIIVVPGMHNDVVAIATGYGRDAKVGRAAASDATKGGKNAYPFTTFNGTNVEYYSNVNVVKVDEKYEVAIIQTHSSYENRPVVHEFTLDEFRKDPHALQKERGVEISHYSQEPWHEGHHGEALATPEMEDNFREKGTLYPNHPYEGIKWGMSIDLNTCTGCGACVVGCVAENNISVVGKYHALRSHEMHWIRIDRYFSGMPDDPDTIQTIFQPMLCQHCDNAPCENVCPVSATNHSTEGLNQMAYNRCIGTKYCANNCPYKVRHFNWMDWNGADAFKDNIFEDGRRDDINDDLTRMVLNPDVTVRSRGVMEKCTFCVQRLQEAKLAAKKAGRPMMDGEAKTACQQSCPSDCITFGNVNDKESEIYKIRRNEQIERTFYVLEHVHTLPNINYLSRVRNTAEIVAGDEKKDGMYAEHI
ncbi:TAT-variant-translocated molybdopterin oxidoreductase [Nemorincola caseinilytica]|uniref:TAT-variant-translocated molybdopterin oxidoreductase n=1 Tax=Nemorincola caseinilytica TaxID=2054315 RepID=A0ABP8NGB3_9BACT